MTAPALIPVERAGRLHRGRSRRTANGGGGRESILALLPFVAFLAVFALYPLYELGRLAFSETSVEGGVFVSEWAGLENFGRVFADPAAGQSAAITALFIVVVVTATVVLGLATALLAHRSVWLSGIARNVLIWPAVITPVVVSVMWLMVLSPTVGGLNKLLGTLGLPTQGWLNSGPGAFFSVVVVDVWHWSPVVFLFMFTALRGLDTDVLEAARVDGATEAQVFWRIVLPLLRPTLVIVILLRLVMSIKAFDEMYLLTGGGPAGATNLISLHIRATFFDRLDFGYAAALSIIIVVATLGSVGIAMGARRAGRVGSS